MSLDRVHFEMDLFLLPSKSSETFGSSSIILSSKKHSLSFTVPQANKDGGRRASQYTAPSYWNSLPLSIWNETSFSQLKSLLFSHLNTPCLGFYFSPPSLFSTTGSTEEYGISVYLSLFCPTCVWLCICVSLLSVKIFSPLVAFFICRVYGPLRNEMSHLKGIPMINL